MQVGRDTRVHLATAAAAFTVLSLLPIALSGSAPSHTAAGLHDLSLGALADASVGILPRSNELFAAFQYDRGQVFGTYVQFAYDATNGTITSLVGLSGTTPVQYARSVEIAGFAPQSSAEANGSTFVAQGYLVTVTAHDDPTALVEIHSDMARTVAIELPASTTDVLLHSAPGSWPASSVSYNVGQEQARFLLGAGSFSVSGTRLIARMAESDLLVFKSVPPRAVNKAEWRVLLDAISAGHVVAELDLVATSRGQWIQNVVQYRIGVEAWALAVTPGRAAVQVDSLLPGGAVVLLAFDSATMPFSAPAQLKIRVNGAEVNRTENSFELFLTSELRAPDAWYSVLQFPGTVLALYLPALAAVSIEIASSPSVPTNTGFDVGSQVAMIAALALVSAAAARMLRRRDE